jgi:hypothetical protein
MQVKKNLEQTNQIFPLEPLELCVQLNVQSEKNTIRNRKSSENLPKVAMTF